MAKEHPRYQSMEWPDWEFQEFPAMIYPTAPDPKKPYDERGRPLPGVIVQNQAEADEVLGIDRSAAEPQEGVEGNSAAPTPRTAVPTASPGVSRLPTAEDEKAELIAEAERLGIQQFDKRWSIARMQDCIDTFKAEVV